MAAGVGAGLTVVGGGVGAIRCRHPRSNNASCCGVLSDKGSAEALNDRGGDPVGGVLLDEVFGVGQLHQDVVGKCRTQSGDNRFRPECDILHPPNQQGGLGAQRGWHLPGEPCQQGRAARICLGISATPRRAAALGCTAR